MERIFHLKPAFDKLKTNPEYGISAATLFMVIKGDKGAVVFSLITGWYLKETEPWLQRCERLMPGSRSSYKAIPAGLSYCSYKPLTVEQVDQGRENCDWLKTTCYGDISFLAADEVFQLLTQEGSDAAWHWLENYYQQIFENVQATIKAAT